MIQQKVDDHSYDENEFDIWFRYDLSSFMDGAIFYCQMPTEDMTDNIKVGLGMSFSVWNSLYLEPVPLYA